MSTVPPGRAGRRGAASSSRIRISNTNAPRVLATPRPAHPGDQAHRERSSKLRPVGALRVERDGPLLRVTLARPERRNAFDATLIAELTEAFADVGEARAVVLAGEGPSFG